MYSSCFFTLFSLQLKNCCELKPPSATQMINFNFLFQSLTRDISYSMENLAIVCSDESWLNNHFSLHHSIIFFLNGWENLHYELGIERVNTALQMQLWEIVMHVAAAEWWPVRLDQKQGLHGVLSNGSHVWPHYGHVHRYSERASPIIHSMPKVPAAILLRIFWVVFVIRFPSKPSIVFSSQRNYKCSFLQL